MKPYDIKAIRQAMLEQTKLKPYVMWVGAQAAEALGFLGGAGAYQLEDGEWVQVECYI